LWQEKAGSLDDARRGGILGGGGKRVGGVGLRATFGRTPSAVGRGVVAGDRAGPRMVSRPGDSAPGVRPVRICSAA